MKKNKNKYILMGLTVPIIASTLPVENVFANENEIPKLNVYMNDKNVPKLEWATEILKENILVQNSFEANELLPTIYVNNSNGQQSFVTETSFNGLQSLKVGKTVNYLGNNYSYPSTKSNSSRAVFNERIYIPNGINLSVNMKVKTNQSIKIESLAAGGNADRQLTFQKYFNSDKPFTFTEDVKAGQNYFYVSNVKEFKSLIGAKTLYTVDRKSKTGAYSYLEIMSIDEDTGKVTVKNKFQETFKKGEDVLKHHSTTPVIFPNRTVNNTNNEWETISFNTVVSEDVEDFNTLTRGILFRINSTSYGDSYIDDVVFGYATEVEVFRDDVSIYKGFLSDFEDTSMKDTLKPNKIETINTNISNDFNINFKPLKPNDQSKKINYTIQSIANNGSRSEMSKKHTIDTATGVKKYKYTINSSKNTPTTLANTTNGLDFNVPISQLNLENDYIHIQAIDGANNESSITTYKLKDIVNLEKVNSLYESLNKVEDSMNYNEFIEFIEEVETMYGANIPLDVKNKIQELAAYHNANTAFLLLLEGDFILTTSDITSFGKTKLTAKKQILYTNFAKEFNIIDARGTQQGYSITVSATPFIEDTFNGFVGEPVQLPIGTLALNPVSEINQIGLVHNSQKPTPQTINSTIIDSGSVNVLQADKGQGMGEFVFNFGDKPLSMVVDSTTAKIDNVNYPSGTTPYTSTITWNLITGP